MGKYFGTDGFRGNANVTLTVEHAYKVGRYIGYYFGKDKEYAKVVIGKDTRRSSYMFEYALVAGLTASGAHVSLMHVTTTPSVAYITRTDNFDCGIMISASHNPYYDNGIKLINSKGYKMEKEVEDLIEKYIDGNIEELSIGENPGDILINKGWILIHNPSGFQLHITRNISKRMTLKQKDFLLEYFTDMAAFEWIKKLDQDEI